MSNDDMSYEEVCQKQISDLEEEVERLDRENNRLRQIQGWLKALSNDNKMIVWAAARAESAARYIIGEKED